MKLNGRDVTQRRLLLVGTTTIASLGVGMMTAGQVQADTPTRLASSTAATAVVTDPQTQQLSDAQTKASQAASTAATAKVVADQAARADQVAQSAVASAQSHVTALSEQAAVAQATSSAVSTVSAATDQATSALGQVSQSPASDQTTAALAVRQMIMACQLPVMRVRRRITYRITSKQHHSCICSMGTEFRIMIALIMMA